MMTETFFSLLDKRVQDSSSLICIGLEPHIRDLPGPSAASAIDFCLNLVRQTAPFAAAFKLYPAYFEGYGAEGWTALKQVIEAIHEESARLNSIIPVILDARRNDIAATAEAYAKSAFEQLGAHCITLNPYLGKDSIEPFIQDPKKGIFMLCKTSNAGSMDVQNLFVLPTGSDSPMPLYHYIAHLAQLWNVNNNIGIVVDAAHPRIMSLIRASAPDLWFLTSGIDAQGGELEVALKAGLRADGRGMLVDVSDGIVRAADTPAKAAKDLRDRILNITSLNAKN